MVKTCFMHIDVNSAFLSWDAAYRLQHGEKIDLRNIPSVVGGSQATRHGIVLAKSLPASRIYSIKTGMSIMEAQRKAGNSLTVVVPRHEIYKKASESMMEILGRYSPTIERFSIDEAFLDYTGMESLFGEPMKRANLIKDEILGELGFTVNIGVSTNKLLAKMACEFEKPNKVHSLWPWEVQSKMWPLPISDLYMVGRRTAEKLRNKGIYTIGEFAQVKEKEARIWMDSMGVQIWNFANGRYHEQGKGGAAFFQGMMTDESRFKVKGVGNSGTIAFDLDNFSIAHQALLSLCETVGYRLRTGGYSSRVMYISYTTSEFVRNSKQRKFPCYTNSTTQLYERACNVFDDIWGGEGIRQIGVHATNLTKSKDIQLNMFKHADLEIKERRLDETLDAIRAKFGHTALIRGCFLDGQINPMLGGTWGSGSYKTALNIPKGYL